MRKYNWHFPARDGGTRQGYNDGGIATFKGADLYNNLAREICQNSLDAKAEDKKHVVVKFNLTFIEKNKFTIHQKVVWRNTAHTRYIRRACYSA